MRRLLSILSIVAIAAPPLACQRAPAREHTDSTVVTTRRQPARAHRRARRTAAAATRLAADSMSPPPAASEWNSGTSPHASWIGVWYTDFGNMIASHHLERWAARHLDGTMSGTKAEMDLNPTFEHIPYTLQFSTEIDATQGSPSLNGKFGFDAARWAAAHNVSPESIWLHTPSGPVDSAHRVVIQVRWDQSHRWCVNPGAVAYQVDRYRRIVEGQSGAFIDEMGGTGQEGCSKPSLEYPTTAGYLAAMETLYGAIGAAIRPKYLMTNISVYWSPYDSTIAVRGGAAQIEKGGFPYQLNQEGVWTAVEHLIATGIFVELPSALTYSEWSKNPLHFEPDSLYATSLDRGQMTDLSGYYMIVPAEPWHHLAIDLQSLWDVRPDTVWPAAYGVDVGHPLEARHVVMTGTDGSGQPYHIWGRRLEHAYVLVSIPGSWNKPNYNSVGVTVPLDRSYEVLHRNGKRTGPVTSITLHVGEGVILLPAS